MFKSTARARKLTMTMRLTNNGFLAAAVTSCLAVLGAAILPTTASAAVPQTSVRVVHLLSGAKISVERQHLSHTLRTSQMKAARAFGSASSVGGEDLTIALPASAIPDGETAMQSDFLYQELGWQAQIKAGAVDATTPVSNYSVTTSVGTVPDGATNYFHGTFLDAASPGSDGGLDTIPQATAIQQAQSNTSTFEGVLPSGSVTNADVNVLPVGSGTDEYALEIDVTLNSSADLAGHYGDALVGLATGLDSSFSNDPLEGLAIKITAADGTPILGAWNSTRLQSGNMAFADPSAATGAMSVSTAYPDLTGLPAATTEDLGSPMGRPSKASAAHKKSQSSSSLTQVSSGGGSNTTLWVVIAALVTIGLAGAAAYLTRRAKPTFSAMP
jgi:hypothetical protein